MHIHIECSFCYIVTVTISNRGVSEGCLNKRDGTDHAIAMVVHSPSRISRVAMNNCPRYGRLTDGDWLVNARSSSLSVSTSAVVTLRDTIDFAGWRPVLLHKYARYRLLADRHGGCPLNLLFSMQSHSIEVQQTRYLNRQAAWVDRTATLNQSTL